MAKVKRKPKTGIRTQLDPLRAMDLNRATQIVNRLMVTKNPAAYAEMDLLNDDPLTMLKRYGDFEFIEPQAMCWNVEIDCSLIPPGHEVDGGYDEYILRYEHSCHSTFQNIIHIALAIVAAFIEDGTGANAITARFYPQVDNRHFDLTVFNDKFEICTDLELGINYYYNSNHHENTELWFRRATTDPQDIRKIPDYKEKLWLL